MAKHLQDADHDIATVVLNEMSHADLPEPAEWARVREQVATHADSSIRQAGTLTDRWIARMGRQQQARQRLEGAIEAPLATLPLLADRSLGFPELQQLSHALAEELSDQ